jgi:DNA repair exonuclease SbcCD ATPase subunit
VSSKAEAELRRELRAAWQALEERDSKIERLNELRSALQERVHNQRREIRRVEKALREIDEHEGVNEDLANQARRILVERAERARYECIGCGGTRLKVQELDMRLQQAKADLRVALLEEEATEQRLHGIEFAISQLAVRPNDAEKGEEVEQLKALVEDARWLLLRARPDRARLPLAAEVELWKQRACKFGAASRAALDPQEAGDGE